ncbi:hypothetical protein [Chryseobacterium taklimakanense]|uniref:NTF2-like N-terminal transpeptidase n=1 Tax=Chryseobacterium taklimakanense TaxID=536441 RepID=A0A3G8WMP2_9FLAO|nr:hypothetical protein [Chryseobacterium taklimakanense]AZI19444.1 hypothetical protein EIH08_00745 [Chryseobacterium taklimakanense]
MRRLYFLLLLLFIGLTSCKKDSVDATNTKTFQSSINDMASRLNTLQQVKFSEALYILKTFGVDGKSDVEKLSALGKLLNGKKVPEILAMADQTAQKHGIAWTSTGPPSLGEMNIFGADEATEFDPNDIKAKSLSLTTFETLKDSVLGPKAIQVIPRLVDAAGKPIEFSGAALETVLEVFSNGNRILTSKNLMQDNDFRGFTLRMEALPSQKISDNKIDVSVTVKTTNKDYKMSKIGLAVNPKALRMPQVAKPVETVPAVADDLSGGITQPSSTDAVSPAPAGDPKTTVTRFLNNLGAQNLRGAYEVSENPNWGSYETFANPTSGFGGVKNVNVKSISTKSTGANSVSVSATYDVTSKEGKTTALQVTFGLKNVNGEWKISSYNIN